jgi:hypothetical protein
MKKIFGILVCFFLLRLFCPAWPQLTQKQVAEREKWEEFLETAEIVGYEQPLDPREAVTEPWRLTLKKDGITMYAWWKNVEGRPKGYPDSWKWEIAAYHLDKYLGLNMIPPIVMKRFRGDRGSCSLDYGGTITLRQKKKQDLNPSSGSQVVSLNRATYLQRAFDNLIANADRNEGDVLYTKDWRMLLIDHSRAFYTSKKHTKKLLLDENSKPIPYPMKSLPRAFVEKLKSLNFEIIKDVAGEFLTDKEIECILLRRDLIIENLDQRIEKLGQAAVLY